MLLGSSIIGPVKKDLSLEYSDLDTTLTELARLFLMSPSVIGYSVRRGETIAEENNYRHMG
ncbi:MAG: hypothetical protein JRJ45_04715 [Deltaproteobacteria bacterium]|nr:hypothetical protein [Deltaproteobacteria bacterium]